MSFLRKLRKFIIWIVLLFFGSSILFVFIYKWCPVYVTPLMIIRCVQQSLNGEEIKMKHHWIPLEEMSPYMAEAVMCSEDTRFLEHNGFDFVEISKALEERQRGKRKRGGSTISQQTAKNVFLCPYGGWFRKGIETYFTVLIEAVWDKRRIMEVYLNSIEMGDGIYGAEAVAQQHFNCSSKDLSRRHCALIAATLPNPLKFSSKNPSSYMLKRQTRIYQDMKYIEKTGTMGDLSVFEKKEE